MLTARNAQRFHWRLPDLGAIVEVHDREKMPGHRFRRFRVESYPGGRELAHCVSLRALDNHCPFTVAAHWVVEAAAYDRDYFLEKRRAAYEKAMLACMGV